MARMGDWRSNQAEEIPLDGIGGVNIIVKADVHRSGKSFSLTPPHQPPKKTALLIDPHPTHRHQLPLLRL